MQKTKTSEARKRATIKYMKENLSEIRFRVKKADKAFYVAEAERRGLSLRRFILDAMTEKLEREK